MRLNFKLIIMSGLIGIPLLVMSVLFILKTQEELEYKIRDRHMDLAVHLGGRTDAFFTELDRYMTTFLYNYDSLSTALVEKDTQEKSVEANKQKAEQLLRPLIRQFEHFRILSVINAKGELVSQITSLDEVQSSDIDQHIHIIPAKRVIKDKEPFVSGPYSNRAGTTLVRTVAYPFNDRKWLLAVEYSLGPLEDMVKPITIGRSGNAFLVDATGRLAAHPDMKRVLAREDMSGIPEIKKYLNRKTGGAGGTEEFSAPDGAAMLGAFQPVQGNWLMVVQEPKREAYQTTESMKNLAVIFVLISIFFAMAAGLYVTRSILNPMRLLEKGTEELGRGNIGHSVDIESHDEMGKLARAFNHMSTAISQREKAIKHINDTAKNITAIMNRNSLAAEGLKALEEISGAGLLGLMLPDSRGDSDWIFFIRENGRDTSDGRLPGPLLEQAHNAMQKRTLLLIKPDSGQPLQPAVAVPLAYEKEVKGAIVIAGRDGREFTPTELDLFEIIASAVAISAQNIELLEETQEKTRMEQELQTAELLQKTLFPQEGELPQAPGLDLDGYIESASETGGDWYGFVHEPQNRRLAILIADVTGHGVPAALVTATTNSFFRTLEIFRSYAHQAHERSATQRHYAAGFDPLSPDFMLRCLNEIILQSTKRQLVMTLFACVYYYDERRLVFANAGHNPPMIFRKDGFQSKKKTNKEKKPKYVKFLMAKGMRLGDEENVSFQEHQIDLEDDDIILWYTDGLIECENPQGEEFGEMRLKRLFQKLAASGADAGEIKTKLLTAARNYYDNIPHKDDITFVVGKSTALMPEAPQRQLSIPGTMEPGKGLNLRRALVVHNNKKFVTQISRFLTGHGAEVTTFQDVTQDMESALDTRFDLCMTPLAEDPLQIALARKIQEMHPDTDFIFTTSLPFDDIIPIILEMKLPLRLIRDDSDDLLSMVQISAAKLFAGPFQGLGQFLAGGTQIHTLKLRDTSTRMKDASPLFRFAQKVGISGHAANNLENVTDELLMNAMFDAPRDRHGNFKYASLPRANRIKLNELEAPVLEYGSDGTYLGVSVADPFGGLTRDTVLNYFEKCLFNTDKQYDDKPGGAGLGLFEIYRTADHLIFDVKPGRRTEVICLFRLKLSARFTSRSIESLSYFERSGRSG